MSSSAVQLHPPQCFGIVQEPDARLTPSGPAAISAKGVYRSQAPTEENLPYLARMKLRNVLFLSPEVLMRGVVDWMTDNNVVLHNLGLQRWKPDPTWSPLSDEFVKDALELILDANNHPILVCCASGVYQTAPLVGCLRRVQNWSLTAVLDEYRAFAGTKARLMHEQFVELFDTDLVTLPQSAPSWFVDYHLVDPRQEQITRENLESQLRAIENVPYDQISEEDAFNLRRCRFELRLITQAYSTQVTSKETMFTKQSIIDDEDDD